ncbi:MAG TPA: hypothetical protein EYN79_10990 [Planctomycetes bacterium]|nr:hypothetical protein [Planctomycetota bacterium]
MPRLDALSALFCLILLLLAGCSPGPTPRDGPTPSRAALDRQLWSPTVHYHGVRFRFELDPTTDSAQPMVLPGRSGDRLSIGNLEVAYQRGRFLIGGILLALEEDAIVWVLRPPSADRPFWLSLDGLRLRWPGNGFAPVVQEDLPNGSRRWFLGRSQITLQGDGTVLFHRLGEDRRWRTPVDLDLDGRGKIIIDGGVPGP